MKIIVFSTNGLDPHYSLGLLNEDIFRECEYITTANKLSESLNNSRYDLIIIDSDDYGELNAAIREQIGAMEGLSVLLLRNAGRKSNYDDVMTAKDNALPRKMVLHRGEDRLTPQSNRDRDIIRATAATLGHEINNPLMSIYASAEMILKENPTLSSGAIEKIRQISNEVSRIKKSTDILIDLDRILLKMTPSGNMIDVNRLIADKDTDDACGEDGANKHLDINPS